MLTCPLAVPALFFAAGIVSGRYGPALAEPAVYTALVVVLSLFFLLLTTRTNSFLKPLLVALSFFVAGNANTLAITPPQLDQQLVTVAGSGHDVVFSGILRTAPSFDGQRGKFIVDANWLRTAANTGIPINTRILVKTAFPPPDFLIPGEPLLLRGSLTIPTSPGTPGSFDYRRYLADQFIPITGFIRSPAFLKTAPAPNLPDKHIGPTRYLPQQLRHRTNLFIDSTDLSPGIKGLYKAIITGQRASIPANVLQNFKQTGAIHLLAISGMHMGLLALLSGLLINYLLRRSSWLLLHWPAGKISAALTLLVMAAYGAISGLQPPVVRAFIMASMLIIAIIIDRPKSLLNALALAAILILLYDPAALFSVSFQLSFGAVTAILIFTNQFPHLFTPDPRPATIPARLALWLRSGIIISLIALFATAPLTIYHFHQVSILGPLTTIIIAPLLCFLALPLGLAASVFWPLCPSLAAKILLLGSVGLTGADLITGKLALIPFTFHVLPPPAIVNIIVYYLLGGYLLFGKPRVAIKFLLAIIMAVTIIIPIDSLSSGREDGLSKVTFLDVGQGNATLLELAGKMNVLVDGGGYSSATFNCGERIIGPFLWHKSIHRLDYLIISHDHQDHYNGLEFIIRNFRPTEVWINGPENKSPEYVGLLKAAAEVGAQIRTPARGTVIVSVAGVQLTSISNLHLREERGLTANNRSLVVKLAAAGHKIILPGDIMADDGQFLINQGVDLNCDILLAPHHGSRYSAGYHLVQAGRPKWLIVSAAPSKYENFPDRAFVDWCKKQGTNILNTANRGTIEFTLARNGNMQWRTIFENMAGRTGQH